MNDDDTQQAAPAPTAQQAGATAPAVSQKDGAAGHIVVNAELLTRLEWAVRFIDTYARDAAGPATPEVNKCRDVIAQAKATVAEVQKGGAA